MKIAFINSGKSYLPEIKAYISYINKQKGFFAKEFSNQGANELHDFDVIWKFPGLELQSASDQQLLIHEYNSLSAGVFNLQKDFLKKVINVKPTARIFLNELVREQFNFKDNIPFFYRDMGIANNFFINNTKKEYDFVYIGSMEKTRKIDMYLKHFQKSFSENQILMIGAPPDDLYNRYKRNKNIIFTGSLEYEEVPKVASKAIYGLNLIPDIFPYNRQTSTKVLEYCAMGLKVVTSNYRWVNRFENSRNARFFKLESDLGNFNMESIEDFDFYTPDVGELTWETIIENAGLIQFIKHLYNKC